MSKVLRIEYLEFHFSGDNEEGALREVKDLLNEKICRFKWRLVDLGIRRLRLTLRCFVSLRHQYVIAIYEECLLLVHDVVEDVGLDQWAPSNGQSRVAFVFEDRRVTVAPTHGRLAA